MNSLPNPDALVFEPFTTRDKPLFLADSSSLPLHLNHVLSSGAFIGFSRKDLFILPFIFISITLLATQLSPNNIAMIILFIAIFGYMAARGVVLKFISLPMTARYREFAQINNLIFNPIRDISEFPNLENTPPLNRDSRIYPYQIFEFRTPGKDVIRVYNVQSENRFLTSRGFGTKTRTIGVIDIPNSAIAQKSINNEAGSQITTYESQTLIVYPKPFNFTKKLAWNSIMQRLSRTIG